MGLAFSARNIWVCHAQPFCCSAATTFYSGPNHAWTHPSAPLQQQQQQRLILENLSTLSPPTSARNRPQKQTSAARCSAQKVHRTAVSSSELSAALRDTSHSFMGLKSRKLEVRALKTFAPKVFIMQPAPFFPSKTPSWYDYTRW